MASGDLTRLDGSVRVGDDGTVAGVIRIHVESLRTGLRPRDAHIRSADFLAAHRYPFIEFFVSEVSPRDSSASVIRGQLDLHGRRRDMRLDAMVQRSESTALEFTIATTIDRRDFGVTFNLASIISWRVSVAARIYLVGPAALRVARAS